LLSLVSFYFFMMLLIQLFVLIRKINESQTNV
jgi:hypothetical protein